VVDHKNICEILILCDNSLKHGGRE